MNFAGLFFLFLFLPISLLLYYNPFFRGRIFRNWLLLLLSFVFYVIACPSLFPLLIVMILVNFVLVRCEIGFQKKWIGNLGIAFDVAVLCFYKYVNILVPPVSLFFTDKAIITSFIMPLGLSYYTFNAISMFFDCRKYNLKPDLLETALHICFFPKIVSGPVAPFENICADIRGRHESCLMFCRGFERISSGLIKKVLIADPVSEIVGYYFNGGTVSMTGAWLGALAFSLQLFFDFSAFTDLAIGIGNLFGFRFMENFNFPYAANSVSSFWRRWHISLTKWFTNYLYIPLGGNKVSKPRHIFNIAVVWICTGLWHGSSVTFLIWAGIQFVCLILEKYANLKNYMEKHSFLGHIYVLLIALFSWTAFRSESGHDFVRYLSSMFGCTGLIADQDLTILKGSALYLIICCIFCFPVRNFLLEKIRNHREAVNLIWHVSAIILCIFALCIRIISGNKGVLSLYANF